MQPNNRSQITCPVKNWFQYPQDNLTKRHYLLNTNIQFALYAAPPITRPTSPIVACSLSHLRKPVPFNLTFQPLNPRWMFQTPPSPIDTNAQSKILSATSGAVLQCLPTSSPVHSTSSTTTRIDPATYINTHTPPASASECKGGGGHQTTKEQKKPVRAISTQASKECEGGRRDEDTEERLVEGVDYMYEITDEMMEKGMKQYNPLCDDDYFGDFNSEEIWCHLHTPYSIYRYGTVCTLINWKKMEKNEPFAVPLPVLHPMGHLQAYLLDVVNNYQKYNDMMNASVTSSASVLHMAFNLRKIGEGITKMGSSVNNLNVNYEDLL